MYRLASEAPVFREMLTGLEAFLEPPSVSVLRPCTHTYLRKALCHTRPFAGARDKWRINVYVTESLTHTND